MESMAVERQKKPKGLNFYEGLETEEDRISSLPDCLLLEIVSSLRSTKCAIKTGVLSKRWFHLWTSVPSLYFNDSISPRFNFFSSINKTLAQCRQVKLKKFVVYTCYNSRYQSQVNNWIHYAIGCNVEELNLTLWNPSFIQEFELDQIFFTSSCFTDLKLKGCIFYPVGAISWANLRSLRISYGNLDEYLIENILSGSPLLETFVLKVCYGYRRLNITSKSVKSLVLSGYRFRVTHDKFAAYIIDINAPNILSLTIRGELYMRKVFLVNVSSLVEANLDYKNSRIMSKEVKEELLTEIILNLCHVKEIKIGARCTKVALSSKAKGFAFPSYMKFQVATYNWSDGDPSSDSYSSDSSNSDSSDSVGDLSDSDSSDSDSVGDSSDSDSSIIVISDSD